VSSASFFFSGAPFAPTPPQSVSRFFSLRLPARPSSNTEFIPIRAFLLSRRGGPLFWLPPSWASRAFTTSPISAAKLCFCLNGAARAPSGGRAPSALGRQGSEVLMLRAHSSSAVGVPPRFALPVFCPIRYGVVYRVRLPYNPSLLSLLVVLAASLPQPSDPWDRGWPPLPEPRRPLAARASPEGGITGPRQGTPRN